MQSKKRGCIHVNICERCRANDTDLKDMKRDISDIKKELSKMCNDIGESSTDIKTHIEKKIESAKELQSQCSGQKDYFANIVKKCQMPNLDSINENVKKRPRRKRQVYYGLQCVRELCGKWK